MDGYGELAIPYRTPLDLVNMRYQISLTTGHRLQGRYALDKVLHPTVEFSDAILTSPSSTVMIGIREPDASVRSIRAMGLSKTKPDWKADPKRACGHYTRRLDFCVRAVGKRPDTLVFPTDALLNDTATFLSGLTQWLGLSEPLRVDYEVGSMTGRAGFGDTSARIATGSLTRERSTHDVDIPRGLLDKAWDAYDRTLDLLFARADRVLCPDGRVQRKPAEPSPSRESDRPVMRPGTASGRR